MSTLEPTFQGSGCCEAIDHELRRKWRGGWLARRRKFQVRFDQQRMPAGRHDAWIKDFRFAECAEAVFHDAEENFGCLLFAMRDADQELRHAQTGREYGALQSS